ncbi:hypothetical protein K431DRAFT_67202 [Polychaeton citri CBS 116435]|uniref:Uncharacterized protein n=1 Tax=Polychaeton citri CBS 116435 TaxID=1314669 RepID=A0A9P4QBN5_9PEZI|nr:hypothetical protein K431DRAFT_67202 [Polychaeton citri CBS 116435]
MGRKRDSTSSSLRDASSRTVDSMAQALYRCPSRSPLPVVLTKPPPALLCPKLLHIVVGTMIRRGAETLDLRQIVPSSPPTLLLKTYRFPFRASNLCAHCLPGRDYHLDRSDFSRNNNKHNNKTHLPCTALRCTTLHLTTHHTTPHYIITTLLYHSTLLCSDSPLLPSTF